MLQITQLDKVHDRKSFDCGNEDINRYLKQQANQSAKKHYSQTHVLMTDEAKPKEIIGFYTLTSCFLKGEIQKLIQPNSPFDLCGIKLARMGVDTKHQKQNHAQYLIFDAMKKAHQVNQSMGIQGLFLDAKNDDLVRFYQHCGFVLIPDTERVMWIPIGVMSQLLG